MRSSCSGYRYLLRLHLPDLLFSSHTSLIRHIEREKLQTLSDLQVCVILQPYLPGYSCFSSQARGSCLLHQSSQDGIPHLGKSPFHISSGQNTPNFQGPASVLSFLSILPSATSPYTFLDTSRTFPCQLQLPLIHALLLPTYYLFTRIWRFSFSSSESGRQHNVCTFLYLLSLGQL